MEMIGIIGLIAAIIILVVGAFKGLGPLPLTLVAAFVAIITNGVNIWEALSKNYMAGYAGTYTNFFLIFVFSALYAKLMEVSGSASAIGFKLIDWFGKQHVMLISILIFSVLTYGGVSLFVVIFAAGPIMFMLFKEANLPRHLGMAVMGMGTCTYTMTSLPGTPALTNIIPSQILGTPMTSAPVLSMIISAAMFVMCYFYCEFQVRKARENAEFWTYPTNIDPALYDVKDRSLLPSAVKAFSPIILLISIIVIGGRFVTDSAMLTVAAMIVASILCYSLNIDKFRDKQKILLLNEGLGGGIVAIGGLAAVVGFGSVVQNMEAFKTIVSWLLGLNMHPYVEGVFSTAVISGITGSSSGGLRITLQTLGEHFVGTGCNLEVLHRLMSVSAGSLDTLPHSAGLFMVLQWMGLSHKEGYRHLFWTSVVVPSIVVVIATTICVLMSV